MSDKIIILILKPIHSYSSEKSEYKTNIKHTNTQYSDKHEKSAIMSHNKRVY